MKEKIEALARQFQQELEGAGTSDAVEKLRVAYLGRKGSVTQLLKGLKEVEAQQKKELGQHINMLKKTVEDKLSLCVSVHLGLGRDLLHPGVSSWIGSLSALPF